MALGQRSIYIAVDRDGTLRPPPLVPHPFTIGFLVTIMASGLSLLLFGPPAGAGSALLPHWAAVVWAVLLVIGGICVLSGTFWKDLITGLLLEVAGSIALIPASILYVGVVLLAPGFNRIYVLSLFVAIAYGIGSAYRIYQIQRFINAMRRAGIAAGQDYALAAKTLDHRFEVKGG